MKYIMVVGILFAASAQIQAQQRFKATIDINAKKQVIRNFGASDAWSCKYAGNWPEAKKNAIADWLFSSDTTATGQPKGIALSLWRFNIGAGSTQQGDSSGIHNKWRREESFWELDRSWNFNRQAGQRWFLQAAKKRGVPQLLGFLNSPPVQLTRNGKAFASKGECNISSSNYAALADYITTVISGLKQHHGIVLDYISPVNEPQWDWSDGGQEGCPYNNTEISGVIKQLDQKLTAAHLPTKIIMDEAAKIDYLYSAADKPLKGQQVQAFFNEASADNIGNLPSVYRAIAGHSYFTTSPDSTAVAQRKKLAAAVAGVRNLEYWQTEYCILGDNAGEINGNKKDLGMDAALYMARVIHNDLTVANASTWQWWLGVSPSDYKDGLVYISNDTADGSYEDSKMLWVLGNYSRFVRPGASRVAVALNDSSSNKLLVSAYTQNNRISIVVVNSNRENVRLDLQCLHAQIQNLRAYTTSNEGNLAPAFVKEVAGEGLLIPARSVVTFTGTIHKR